MSTDRELLELAAKAARIEVTAVVAGGIPHRFGGGYWNPLTDDGDAFRLMIDLDIDIYGDEKYRGADAGNGYGAVEQVTGDLYAATRRAITRAAAEIGKGMP
jgi:hypothetical protein